LKGGRWKVPKLEGGGKFNYVDEGKGGTCGLRQQKEGGAAKFLGQASP